jgi:DNA-binding beta-propeller fold protein YncE
MKVSRSVRVAHQYSGLFIFQSLTSWLRLGFLFSVVPCACQALLVSPLAYSQVAQPVVEFGTVNVGSASSPIAVPLTINSSAVLGSISVLTEGTTGLDFASAGTGTCSSGSSYKAGDSCTVNVTFTPILAANRYGAVVLVDLSYNVIATSYVHGTGVGSHVNPLPSAERAMSTSSLTGTSRVATGASDNLSATATSPFLCSTLSTSPQISGICTIQKLADNLSAQTITFEAIPNQVSNTSVPVTLTATADSGLPVTYTSTTPAICTVSTSASTAMLLAEGTCTIQADQPGDGVVYAAAPTVAQSFTIQSVDAQTSQSFGAVNAGSASSPISVSLSFNTAAILGSASVLTQGASGLDFANAGTGNCMAGTSYNAGSSCVVNVTFTPTSAGSRYGAVVLKDGAGNPIATSYLEGTGVGPQLNFLPGAESTVTTSALSWPSGIALDGNGNVYIADTGNNRVLKETLSGASYIESTVPSSTLSYPSAIAVDGAGNIYISDTGNNRLLIETPSSGNYTERIVPTSTLSYPEAVAVDGSGNVYVADTGNNRVVMETPSSGSYTETTVPTSALAYPSGVAADGSGNVFISDSGNNRVLMEALSGGSYTESTMPASALSYPGAITVDGLGSIYIADSGNGRLLKETPSTGSYTESTVSTSFLTWPSGVAVAGSGNIYIVDAGSNSVLKEDLADSPNVSFAATAPGSVSLNSPQTITVENIGNATLNFPIPSSGDNPSISPNFTLNTSGASSCPLVSSGSSTAGTLMASQSCLLLIGFAPTSAGDFSGALILTDNALNAAGSGMASQQSLALNGIGTGSTTQSIIFEQIPVQSANSILALTATASSGLPVSFASTTPSICAVSGSNSSLLTAGTCTIVASQMGSPVYAAAPTVTQSFTVNLAAQTITFEAIPSQSINTSVGVSLTATASSGMPVNFSSTTPAICTVSTSTSTAILLAAGTCTIQADQPGDGVANAAAPTVTRSFSVQFANLHTGTSFGAANIGSTSAASITLTMSTAATLDTVSVLTQGATGFDFSNAGTGNCTAGTSYSAGSSCTVNVTFTPTVAGSRYGAVVLKDGAGNPIATSYLEGTGVGPQLNFLPGTESAVPTSGLSYATGIAVDGSGNLFIADSGHNRVLKETLSAGVYTESAVSTSDLDGPSAVAVDGGGNLYIADTGNNRVLKETFAADSYSESVVPTSGLSYPSGVAVDGSGNLYIADTYNNRVLTEAISGSNYVESVVPTSALESPSGVALDGSGNVYIADSYNNRVLIETFSEGKYTESTMSTSALNYPSGVSVNGNGSVFVTDTYNHRVLMETLSAGSYIESTVSTSALNNPSGVALDGNGNIYIVDTGNDRVLKEDLADVPNLSFTATAPGSTSSDSPRAVTLENVGNAALNFPVPNSGNNPEIAANFTLSGDGSPFCPVVSASSSIAGTLAAGQSCLSLISFTPTSAGTFSGSLALSDNALNTAATQSVPLSGIGTGSTQQTIIFGPIPAQTANSTFALTATASSGLPVSLISTTPAICTVLGSTASLVSAGICTIQASQMGSPVYAAAPTVTQSFAVNLKAQTITFDAIPTQAINTSVPIALSAWATSGLPVSLTSTTPTICTVSSLTATLLANGSCTIQATQPGDGIAFAAAPTIAQSFNVQSANPLSGQNFGAVNIGSASSPIAVTLTFTTATALGSVSVLTQGATGLDFANAGAGTCTVGASYNVGDSCSVSVTFTPSLAGARYGAVVLENHSGNVIATSYLQGTGIGPQVNFLPGTESAVTASVMASPSGVAVDASGNVYIADSGNNRVLKETPSEGGYIESTVPTSTLAYPYGIAVDGSGNLYIADYGNNRVLKETPSAGSYTESTVPTSPLSFPSGVAVDGSGNLYIADTYNDRVLMETLSSGSYTESTIPTSGLNGPSGVAVDGSGNLYIADTYNDRVLLETFSAGSYTESTVPTSALSDPSTISVTGNGNLYITDSGNDRVLLETLSLGSYTESTVSASNLGWPSGVAVAGNGNVYIADTSNNRVLKEDLADAPSLTFALTSPGATSSDSPQTVIVENAGNADLTLPTLGSGSNPSITANFILNSSRESACPVVSANSSTAATLVPGQSCLLPISFVPTETGNFSGSLVMTDNALNIAAPGYTAQRIRLSGIGTGSTQQSISFGPIPSQPATSTLALTATASSGLPVSFTSITPVVCKVSGSSASLVGAGTCTIQANQMGSTVYAAAPTVAQSFAVNLLDQTISFPEIPVLVINTSVPFALTATADSGLPVNYTSTTPAICTVSPAASKTTLLTTGTCTIQASQPGDGVVYAAALPVTQNFTIESAAPMTSTNFGAVEIGTSSSAIAVTVNFKTAATMDGVSVLTQGASGLDFANAGSGTCTAGTGYNAGDSCTVNVTFTPMVAGTRNGAVALADGSGNLIATTYLQGTGIGPQLAFLPGSESIVPTSSLWQPSGIAVDGSGNVYVADMGNNRVLEETLSLGSYTESTVSSSALASPSGVAVDGAGNVYILDSGNSRVLIETPSPSGYIESTVPTSDLSYASGVAVDGSGNVYVADTGNNRVLLETLSLGSYTESTIPTSSLNSPSGVAVDGNGNVYIADSGNNRVLRETLSSGRYTESEVPTSSLSSVQGVAVDAIGNLYIADSGNYRVQKETLSSAGGYSESTVTTSKLGWLSGVTADSNGNVYIVDSVNRQVLKEDFADTPSLNFAPTTPGTTSSDSPQTLTLLNIGNAALTFPVPTSGSNPAITANFTVNSNGASACPSVSTGSSSSAPLSPGHSCLLPISFAPTAVGAFNGSLSLTDNVLNAVATQNIQLNGTGTGSMLQTLDFEEIPAQPLFSNPSWRTYSTLWLTATASSGLPVSFISTTPATCAVSGSIASLLAGGICTVQAIQAGDLTFSAAPVVTRSFAVNLAAQTITFNPILPQVINTSAGLPLTAGADSYLEVTFTSTTPAICTVPISSSTAMLLAAGTCTIQADQAGDGVVYAAAPPVTQSFTVQSAGSMTSANFGPVNIGSTSSALAVPVTLNTAATLGVVSVLTQGASGLDFADAGSGTCTAGASYNPGDGCTVNVMLTPTLPGDRYGAVVLTDSFGNVIATSYLQGTGIGPQVNFLPNTESTVSSSALYSPSGVAVDANGNVYIADTYNQRVLKETFSSGSYIESTVPNSAFYPYGIAVDGAGNIYIADTGYSRVLKETFSAGGYIESTVPTSTLNWPFGVAVDGSGNVYIPDTYNHRVLKETLSAGTYTESVVPTSPLSDPFGIAVDGSGTVYISDSYEHRVLKETLSAGSYTETTLPTSGLSGPYGVAVDGNGSVYIVDYYYVVDYFGNGFGASRVLKETLSSGNYTQSTVETSSLNGPFGVAVDGSGNVYLADTYNNRVLKEDFADPPSLSFAPTAPGMTSSDSPQMVTVKNVGNAPLTFPVPNSGDNPQIVGSFVLNSETASDCPLEPSGSSLVATLAAGQYCMLAISFAPPATGNLSGSLALYDNSLNATATQTIQLSGTGTGTAQQTITFALIPTQGAGATLVLTATASSGLPVSFSSTTPAICTISGVIASLLADGTCTIQANQTGSSVYAAAPTVTQSFSVSGTAQTITFDAIPNQILNTSVGIALTARANSYLPVSFTSITPSICTVTDSMVMLLTTGTCTIQANQPGDGVYYAAAPTVTQSFTIESANPLTGPNFGTVNIGSASSAISIAINFNTAATLGGISVTTQGATGLDFTNADAGTCAVGASYNFGDSCTVNVTFTPTRAGTRYGAIRLEDGSGNVIGTSYLQGTGAGPQVTFLPGAESIVSTSGLYAPLGAVVDADGNIYILDTGHARVLKETLSSGGYTESILPTSVLAWPLGIAVDGGGNIYIADTYNQRLLKETYSSGSYTESTVPTGAPYPRGVAVDGSGNIYIVDPENNRVLIETLSSNSYIESTLPTSTLASPLRIAVDGSGNLYIADFNNRRVLKETLSSGGYIESTLPTNLLYPPSGVAVDGIGNVYITDSDNNRVLKETLSAGSYTETTLQTSPLSEPNGIAVDGSGNVYIADSGHNRVLKEDFADPPSLSFAPTAVGSTSSDSPQIVTVENVGNAPLNFPVPSSGSNPSIPANFTLDSSGTAACPLMVAGSSSSGTLAAGQSCLLSVSFTPTIEGNLSGSLALIDNALNATAPAYATQSILLSGIGMPGVQANQTINFPSISSQSTGVSIPLAAIADSGLQVTYTSITPAVCTISDSTALLLTEGTCTIQADQAGNDSFLAAPTVTQSFEVDAAGQTSFFIVPTSPEISSTAISVSARKNIKTFTAETGFTTRGDASAA